MGQWSHTGDNLSTHQNPPHRRRMTCLPVVDATLTICFDFIAQIWADGRGVTRMRLWLWLLAMVVTASAISAADRAASGGPSGVLIALEQKWVAALLRSDTKTLTALW